MIRHLQLLAFASLFCTSIVAANHFGFQRLSQWTTWSSCSTTCGHGHQTRTRACFLRSMNCAHNRTETRFCMDRFCPSYLSWPRFHFFGRLVTDVSTLNNVRCNYDTKYFAASSSSSSARNWGPDGNGHLYFSGLKITSFCKGPDSCSTTDYITNLRFKEKNRGVFVDLSPDWMRGTEIWGLSVVVESTFEAKLSTSGGRKMRQRIKDMPGDTGKSVSYKSKLRNITWYDGVYKTLFKNASELSISFVFDRYEPYSKSSRMTGTVGLTSSDDPKLTVATRVLHGRWQFDSLGIAPFFIHYDHKYITLDLSNALNVDRNGKVCSVKSMDLALLLNIRTYCKYFWTNPQCRIRHITNKLVYYQITHGGVISKKLNAKSQDWYKVYGGVLDISLNHLEKSTLDLMIRNRLAIVAPDLKNPRALKALLLERNFGIQSGATGDIIYRLNPGETKKLPIFVSKYGKPAVGIHVDVNSVYRQAEQYCPLSCNKTLGWPKDALSIEASHTPPLTNSFGIIEYTLRGVSGPGSPRKCGLDGQLYPLQVLVKYKSISKTYVFEEGAASAVKSPHIDITSLDIAVHLYDEVKNVECPTWNDVKDIFEMYYNLYPVMWKNDIIDLHSYDDIKRKARMLKAAMFDFDIESPRYMPFQRDLSYGKRKLIWNWMKCGMKRGDTLLGDEAHNCEDAEQQLISLKAELRNAIFVEFATIPPYFTAWLSIKSEEGRNKKVADILKSVFYDEMRHMAIASNLLNAVGGKMSISSNRPSYPCSVSMGSFYGLNKDQVISLGRMSKGRASDIFSAIERPVSDRGKELLSKIATLWEMVSRIRDNDHESLTRTLKNFLADYSVENSRFTRNVHSPNRPNSGEDIESPWEAVRSFAKKELQKVMQVEMHTVGGFYTKIALRLAYLESCAQLNIAKSTGLEPNNSHAINSSTIFVGELSYQLNATHWYRRTTDAHEGECVVRNIAHTMGAFPPLGETRDFDNVTIENATEDTGTCEPRKDVLRVSDNIFPVTDLISAMRAVVEIVYQGEGGSGCSPFQELEDDDSKVLSHYYRFQEIVHGRQLVRIKEDLVTPTAKCLTLSEWCQQFHKGWSFCYLGDALPLYEDGIWPIISDPQSENYYVGSRASILDGQFNTVYWNMLHCLDKVFNGNPDHIKFCMAGMYDLTIIGRELVSTNIEHKNDTRGLLVPTMEHASPTFSVIDV